MDIKGLLVEEENLTAKNQLNKSLIKVEELLDGHNLNLLHQLEAQRQEFSTKDKNLKLLESLREYKRKSVMYQTFLGKFIEETSPSTAEQNIKAEQLQNSFQEMLKRFEESPTYHSIIQAEADERELTRLIQEKKNEIMKLETVSFEE